MKKFEIGKSYSTRSICNHECVWTYKVLKRTACTVTMEKNGEVFTSRISKKVSEHFGVETIYPEGRYSMCPVLTAESIV